MHHSSSFPQFSTLPTLPILIFREYPIIYTNATTSYDNQAYSIGTKHICSICYVYFIEGWGFYREKTVFVLWAHLLSQPTSRYKA